MDILTRIINVKRQRIEVAKGSVSLDRLRDAAQNARRTRKPHRLLSALRSDALNIIAEFKRRSPSKGVIRPDADLPQIVSSYQSDGAAAISVLTEEDHFSGSLDDLREAKTAAQIPVLRKDFIFDEYQVYESAAAGADALLLIVAALDDETLARLLRLTEELGLDALVEVHTSAELKRAAAARAKLIGVNNRDLRTFEVSIDTSLTLANEAPAESLLVSESGLNNHADLQRLHAAGYRGFLIGETLMRANNPGQMLRDLRGER